MLEDLPRRSIPSQQAVSQWLQDVDQECSLLLQHWKEADTLDRGQTPRPSEKANVPERFDLANPFHQVDKDKRQAKSRLQQPQKPAADHSKKKIGRSMHHDTRKSISNADTSSYTTNSLVDDKGSILTALVEAFQRRPRRKTKEDKYVLKDKARKRKINYGTEEAPRKRHRRHDGREKSGATLLHTFSAKNVAVDRLTVSILSQTPIPCFAKRDGSLMYILAQTVSQYWSLHQRSSIVSLSPRSS